MILSKPTEEIVSVNPITASLIAEIIRFIGSAEVVNQNKVLKSFVIQLPGEATANETGCSGHYYFSHNDQSYDISINPEMKEHLNRHTGLSLSLFPIKLKGKS
jgi:hypothetical protein